MNTRLLALDEFRNQYPARQSGHTGKWGWRRYLDGIDLRACSFDTEEECIADRNTTIRLGVIDPENGQPC